MTTAKPGARRSAKAAPKGSLVDQMGEDAEALAVEFPEGAPEFKPILAIRPRSKKAEFKRGLAEVAERFKTTNELRSALGDDDEDLPIAEQYRISAAMDEVYEAIEQTLRLAAVDVEDFDAWAAEVSDEDLGRTFNAYQTRTQPGEAPSSTS